MGRYNKRTTEEAQKANLDLLAQLHEQGVNIGDDNVVKLVQAGLIEGAQKDTTVSLDNGEAVRISMSLVQAASINTSPKHTKADEHVTIVYADPDKDEVFAQKERVVTDRLFRQQVVSAAVYSGDEKEITQEMWKIQWKKDGEVSFSPEFVAWIDSINRVDGFWNSTYYKPFELYCRQAERWLSELPDIKNDAERLAWEIQENARCAENSLYACDKYGHLKEAAADGMQKYVSAKAHKILLYLLDCGYSMYIAKARQVAFTTTICLWVLFKAMFRFNFNVKYISEDKIKAEDALENKIKYPYSECPDYIRPESRNDRLQRIVFGEKGEKGERGGNNSGIEVLPPGKTAIASTTPDVTLVDEGGNIDILNSILSDNLPTQYGVNRRTGKLELLRQIIVWGTGGHMEKAGVAFMSVYMGAWKAWNERKFQSGIIPLFFNNWYKPGMTRELYDRLKAEEYAKEGPTAAADRIRFHQTFPVTLEDVFLVSGKTLLGLDFISKNLDRIEREGERVWPDYGYFEPIYDEKQSAHEGSDVPFKIIGAKFVKLNLGDDRVTCMIFSHPKKWRNRYYQGTDPIASDNGHSKMASCIWDKYWAAPVALVNFRTDDYKHVFRQCLLLGIYYNVENGGKAQELIESNNGTAYREYVDNKGLGRQLVYNSELPQVLVTKSVIIGVDNKGLRNTKIVDTIRDIFEAFAEKIWLSVFFTQLKTFVCKKKGNGFTWEPMDKSYNWDDALFALAYSYLCSECYNAKKPENIDEEKAEGKSHVSYVTVRDDDMTLKKIPRAAYEKLKKRNAILSNR